MLLSPLGSPSKFSALSLPLPPLQHDIPTDDDRFVADDSDDDLDTDDSEEFTPLDDSGNNTWAEPPTEHSLSLPVELIFNIVELAATHRRTALNLCRVATWVRAAVLPALYGTLVVHGDGPSPFDLISDVEDGDVGVLPQIESPLRHVRSLWLDVPLDHAPRSLDACPRLVQLALPLEAAATICRTKRWRHTQAHLNSSLNLSADNALQIDTEEASCSIEFEATPQCRSFTVLGQSHPHRWQPLTSSPDGRAFLRGVTHLRLLNLCLSHYIPLEYTPNLTHLCLPFFDLRITSTSFQSTSPTGSAATSSFTGLDYILAQPSLQMVVLTLNPRYWRFDELSLKGWAVRAMARDPRLYVVAATRDDATRDWDVPKRDWEDEAGGGMSVWDKAVCVRRKFLTRLSRTKVESYSAL
ncbi:uncharacterized protein FOMMEDRAFT_169051 [Fomitiporia mediterranea MF3/22]|uniref:uncharacterized protein n=1 Tax=Fomitiporia mediterranea (strain MF3/22) TaxID=694068 RepID=UPI0004408E2D|nr:uncharacterized protein FOMMEDRAFT_169051 [Fomitiporia mediterranea MF3/22]EJD00798.1 hypothetical protein FOMMEDRAFT_169051 [Fomitiporia mediterranea MF3/22]